MYCIGFATIMLVLGIILNSKLNVLKKMLIPAAITGGAIACTIVNTFNSNIQTIMPDGQCTEIVSLLFIFSFIAIGLLKRENKGPVLKKNFQLGNSCFRTAFALTIIYSVVFSAQAILGYLFILIFGKSFGMSPIYGMLIPFGFCEGPGSASIYSSLFIECGWQYATSVSMTFVVVGFFMAFIIGVPFARFCIKRNWVSKIDNQSLCVATGVYSKEEQKVDMGKINIYKRNIKMIIIWLSIMFICYVLSLGLSKVFGLIPGFLGKSLSGLVFVSGFIVGRVIRLIINKLKLARILDDNLLSKIIGIFTDYMIVLSFMAVRFNVFRDWIVPICLECIFIAIVTFLICFILGHCIKDSHKIERILGMYGLCTGTTLNGIALIRIVDPDFQTTAVSELGLMTLPSTIYLVICGVVMLGAASYNYSITTMIIFLLAFPLIMILLGILSKSITFKKS